MKISIIIQTYNRATLLDETLQTLVNQSYPKTDYEILVVDNCSTDHTKQIVEKYAECTDNHVSYLYEPRHGSHFARNGAVKCAKGDILYFTDDDILAEKDMLEQIVQPFVNDPQVVSATGAVRAKWLAPPRNGCFAYAGTLTYH